MSDQQPPDRSAAHHREQSFRPENNPFMPAYDRMWSIFLQLGVNVNNQESIEDFAETIRWAREARQRSERQRDQQRSFIIGAIVSVLGGIATAVATWWVALKGHS